MRCTGSCGCGMPCTVKGKHHEVGGGETLHACDVHWPDAHETPKSESPRHYSIDHVLQFFKYEHLPQGLMFQTSQAIAGLAHEMVNTLPNNAETTVGLRKLLEAKDAFVRAAMIGEVV